MMKRTGKVRWRSQRRLFRREELVLQIEWKGSQAEFISGWITHMDRTLWTDATSEDMSGEIIRGAGVYV